MIGPNTFSRQFQGRAFVRCYLRAKSIDLFLRKPKRFRRQIQTIEFRGQLDDGGVSARLNIGDNPRDDRVNVRAILALCAQKGGKTAFEICILRVQKLRHRALLCAALSGSARKAQVTRGYRREFGAGSANPRHFTSRDPVSFLKGRGKDESHLSRTLPARLPRVEWHRHPPASE